jgi:hypothetical protein
LCLWMKGILLESRNSAQVTTEEEEEEEEGI